MLVSLADKYLMNEFCSVHVHSNNGDTHYHTIRAKKKQGELHLLEQKDFEEFETLKGEIKKGVPIILSFTGSKIINKKVTKQPNYLESILFNQNPDEFYIQEYDLDPKTLVSIARREMIDAHKEQFQKEQFLIVDINIGPFVLETLRDLLGDEKEAVHGGMLSYSFVDNALIQQQSEAYLPESITIGEDVIQGSGIISFSGLLAYFNKENITTNFELELHEYKEEATFKKMFQTYGVVCLAAFFLLLLISYFVQGVYADKSSEIQLELALKNQQITEMNTLKEDRDYKLNIINNSSLGTEHFLSYYISEIGKTVPKQILLEEMEVFPLSNPVRDEESIQIVSKLISVRGKTTSRSSINQWVNSLQEMGWTQKVELTSYSESNRDHDFTISILL